MSPVVLNNILWTCTNVTTFPSTSCCTTFWYIWTFDMIMVCSMTSWRLSCSTHPVSLKQLSRNIILLHVVTVFVCKQAFEDRFSLSIMNTFLSWLLRCSASSPVVSPGDGAICDLSLEFRFSVLSHKKIFTLPDWSEPKPGLMLSWETGLFFTFFFLGFLRAFENRTFQPASLSSSLFSHPFIPLCVTSPLM